MQVDLNGKVALVTGAARNIGLSIADTLAQNGAVVYYTDMDMAPLAERKLGAQALVMNVTDDASVKGVVDTIIKASGRIDILVNNAGVNSAGEKRVNIDKFSPEEWDRVISIDLRGVFRVSQAVLQASMIPNQSGRIINISSVVGVVPLRLQSAFAAAKAGVGHLTRAMAIELGSQGILTNAIAPGSIMTEGTRALFYDNLDDKAKSMLAHIPLGRPGTTEEIAHAVLFLAAPESSYINGQVLCVDGGWTAGYMREF
jgi:3-oxoacyl-[acyl-carrier protein] reductase